MHNPLSLAPALKLGALLAVILFLSKAFLAAFRGRAVEWLGAIAGLADADAILLPAIELHGQGTISTSTAAASVLLALGANAVTKAVIAASGGTRQFSWRVLLALLCMFGFGFAAWLAQTARMT